MVTLSLICATWVAIWSSFRRAAIPAALGLVLRRHFSIRVPVPLSSELIFGAPSISFFRSGAFTSFKTRRESNASSPSDSSTAADVDRLHTSFEICLARRTLEGRLGLLSSSSGLPSGQTYS